MVYRRTENVVRRLAARRAEILRAAGEAAAEGGLNAVQIAPVAARANVAAGTVYRYFPAKTDLVAALVADVAERELAALQRAADAAPGPLSALAAAIGTFVTRALRVKRLAFALLAEPIEADIDAVRRIYRKRLIEEFQARIATASAGGHLPDQDPALSACVVVGVLRDGLLDPLAPDPGEDPARMRAHMQTLTLLALRALGVVDARARGLIVQIALPSKESAAG